MPRRNRKQYRPPCWGKRLYKGGHTVAFRDAGLGLKGMQEHYCKTCNGIFYRRRVDASGKILWRENIQDAKQSPKYNRR